MKQRSIMDRFTLTGFADEIAVDLEGQIESFKSLGIGYMEIRMVDGVNITEHTLDEARAIKRRLDAAGIGVSAIGSPIGKVSIEEPFDGYYPRFLHTLDMAETLGTRYIRLFSFYLPAGEDPEKYRDEVIARMSAFVAEARRRNIVLLHENEAGIYGETAERCAALFAAIPSDHFKAVFDPANFVIAGDEVYPAAYELLKEHIRYIHVKDAIVNEGGYELLPAGEGSSRFPELLRALASGGFAGFLSIEPHLHYIYGRMDVFAAYRQAVLNNEPTEGFTRDGMSHFKRAYDALAGLLDTLPGRG